MNNVMNGFCLKCLGKKHLMVGNKMSSEMKENIARLEFSNHRIDEMYILQI